MHHVAFRTRDPERLARFYREVVGLAVVKPFDSRSEWLDANGTIVMIELATENEAPIASGTMELCAFKGDKNAQRQRLANANVAIEAETEHTIYFRDPDGRRVAVSSFDFAYARLAQK